MRNLYSWLFTVLMLLGTGYILVSGGAKTLDEFGGLLATLSVATATVSIVVTEIGGTVMVLASWALDKKNVQEQLKEAIQPGSSIRTDDFLIQHRKASTTTTVNSGAVKALLPEAGHPELYKKSRRPSTIAIQALPKSLGSLGEPA